MCTKKIFMRKFTFSPRVPFLRIPVTPHASGHTDAQGKAPHCSACAQCVPHRRVTTQLLIRCTILLAIYSIVQAIDDTNPTSFNDNNNSYGNNNQGETERL